MAAIPDDKVQEVRDKVDLVDLIGRYVELRRAGKNYKGRCPFHSEKTPSFNVNPVRKGYKCFGCGAGGDAIRFVMEIEGKGFVEAVRKLADLYNVTLPTDGGDARRAQASSERDQAYALTALATELWQHLLATAEEGSAGRAYLAARGLEGEAIADFRMGYAPAPTEAGWDRLARAIEARRLSVELAEKIGLVARSERTGSWYDRFRGRLMFPVVAPGGEVIAFSGRVVPPHDAPSGDTPVPKYLNSPESMLYTKGKTLFGLAQARMALQATRRAILVEGNLDVVRMHQWGFKETVAPLGTSTTADQAKLLSRFCDQVVMAFDGDAAGKKAAWSALPHLLEADLDVRMVLLPEGEDPDSLGRERMAALLARPAAALEQMMTRMAERAGDAVDARARALDQLLPLVARAPRASQRQLYADRASELFHVPVRRIEARLEDELAARTGTAEGSGRGPSQARSGGPRRGEGPEENSRQFRSTSPRPVPSSAAVPLPLPASQTQLAMLLVDVPHLASVADREGALACLSDDRLARIGSAVIDAARRGDDPPMPELLGLVDAVDQPLVFEEVFAGRYRDLADDPQVLLRALMRRCQLEKLELEAKGLEREIRRAKSQGLAGDALQLQQRHLELRKQAAELSRTLTN